MRFIEPVTVRPPSAMAARPLREIFSELAVVVPVRSMALIPRPVPLTETVPEVPLVSLVDEVPEPVKKTSPVPPPVSASVTLLPAASTKVSDLAVVVLIVRPTLTDSVAGAETLVPSPTVYCSVSVPTKPAVGV